MRAKMARSATQPPFEVPGLRPSSAPPGALVRERKKRKNPRRFGVHLENPGIEVIEGGTPCDPSLFLLLLSLLQLVQ